MALALGTIVVALLGLASQASAHALVEETSPDSDQVIDQPPDRVLMRFTEPVEIAFGAIRVFNTDLERVDDGQTSYVGDDRSQIQVPLQADLPDGTYTVTWRAVSADGHPIAEAFVFHVGEPGAQSQGVAERILEGETGAGRLEGVLFGIVRGINFAGLLVLGGGFVFVILCWQWRRPSVSTGLDVQTRFESLWRRAVGAAWIALTVVTLASLPLQGAVAGDVPLTGALSPDVVGQVLSTRFGLVVVLKIALLVGLVVLWLAARRVGVMRPSVGASVGAAAAAAQSPSTWLFVVGGTLVLGLLATPAFAGHAATTSPEGLNIALDALHVSSAATWIGGLVILLYAMVRATTVLPSDERTRVLAPVVRRFSDIALYAVTTLVLTGLYQAWLQVRALRALTEAPYGIVLLAKVGVFVPLLVLGAVNNRIVKARFKRQGEKPGATSDPSRLLRRLVGGEVALAVVVVGLTAMLVNLVPARLEAGITGPFIDDVRLGHYNLNVLVDPNQAGENAVHLTATTPEGKPARIRKARVLFHMPAENIGPLVARGRRLAPGHFVVQGKQLSIPGEWRLEIVARTGRFEEQTAEVEVSVSR